MDQKEYKTAFKNYVRKGDDSLLQKSLSTESDAQGGYLVPTKIEERLTRQLEISSPLRRLSSTLTISTSAVEMLLDRNGAEVGWTQEIGDRNETGTPQLMKIRIPVHELYAKNRATQKLLDDSEVDIEAWLSSRVANKMSQMENVAFVLGDGNNKPRGFLTYPTAAKADVEWGQLEALKTGVQGDFAEGNQIDILVDTINALSPLYQKGAVWLMSPSALAAVRKLKDHNQQSLWQPALGEASPATLLGYPVEVVEEMPALVAGTASNAIVFGNFKEAYQIVDHTGTHVLRDPYSSKPYVEFYTTKRVGGDVVNFEAIKVISFDII